MANKLQIRRGTKAELDLITLADGELGFTTDELKLYIGYNGQNVDLLGDYYTITQANQAIADAKVQTLIDVANLYYDKTEMDVIIAEIMSQIPTIMLGVEGEPASNSELTRYEGAGSYPIDVVEEVVDDYVYYKWDDKKWPYSEFAEIIDNGNVMIKVPKMYIKVEKDGSGVINKRFIANTKLDGFETPQCFIDHDTGLELPYILVAKYNGSNEGGVLVSKSGVAPQVSTALATSRTRADANNVGGVTGYHLLDMHVKFVLETLYLITFANTNSNTIFPQGAEGTMQNNGALDDLEHHTGYTKGLANYLMRFMGIENYFSNVYTQVDGIKIVDREVFIADDYRNYNSDENTTNYRSIGNTPSTDGYIKELGEMGIPITHGGSASTYYGNYMYQKDDYATLYFGRYWVLGSHIGLFYWIGHTALDYANGTRGVRLVKKPTS